MALLAVFAAGCGTGARRVQPEDWNTIPVTLPNGRQIRAEVALRPFEIARGLKYRASLPEGRGMVFLYGQAQYYVYKMHEVQLPLDIVWMDSNRRIVEIVENAQPCSGPEPSCPGYGGTQRAQFVLEVPAGTVKKEGLALGQTLVF